jgi:hypothetical protein
MRLRMFPAAASVLLAASLFSLAGSPAEAATKTAEACSPWADINGFSDALDKTVFDGFNVAELSGLAVDRGGRLLAVADESYLFTLDSRTDKPVAVQPLADQDGQPLDSEAVAVDRDGSRLITSETEPSILRFTRSGKAVGSLPVPTELKVAPAGRAGDNLTFEGLTMQPGYRTLVASMEGALTGDGADIRRLQTWRRATPRGDFRLSAQFAYRADTGLDISDISATGDGRLFVLERGYTSGVGNTVRVYLADLAHASDVSRVENVTDGSGVRLARKTLIADIASCPSLGATTKQPQPNPLLDNIEGMVVTGRTQGGRLSLLLVSDDNQNPTQTTRLYHLSVRLPRR